MLHLSTVWDENEENKEKGEGMKVGM